MQNNIEKRVASSTLSERIQFSFPNFIYYRYYPSTQRCSQCGHVKTGADKVGLDGNKKHKTKHNEYICYECGAVMERDENAVRNLLALL